MQLVWALIPLILFSVIGIQESFSSEINIGSRGVVLQNEIEEWILYDKISGYIITLPQDWEYTIEGDYRTRDELTIQSTAESTERFKPMFSITDTNRNPILSFDFFANNAESNKDKFLEEFISRYKSPRISEFLINSFEIQSLPEMYIFDTSTETHYEDLDSAKFEWRDIYFKNGKYFQLSFGSGISDYEKYVTGFRNSVETFDPSYSDLQLLSPLKQVQEGIPPKAVTCKSDLQLVFKNNGSPTCIKSETIPKLIERGWGENTKSEKSINTNDKFPDSRTNYDTLLEKIDKYGVTRIIVQLNDDFIDDISSTKDLSEIREKVQKLQNIFSENFPFDKSRITHNFKHFPQIIVETDQQILDHLIASPDVKSIHEVFLDAPSSDIIDYSMYDYKFPPSKYGYDYEAVLKQIEEKGRVRIIVGLDVDFVLEGKLSVKAAEKQRENIRNAQERLIAELPSLNGTKIIKFKYVPAISLEVDKETLDYIVSSPLVPNISEDIIVTPSSVKSISFPNNFDECVIAEGVVKEKSKQGMSCYFQVSESQNSEVFNQCVSLGGGVSVGETGPNSPGDNYCSGYFYESGEKCLDNYCD